MTFHPFAEMYPLMPPEELNRLTTSMRTIGFDERFPIVRYQGKILDGRNRWKSAELAMVKPTFVDFEGTEEEARQFVITANEERRHLSPQWLEQRRRERIDRVVEMRKAGNSVRAIAEAEEVSIGTVQRDLNTATVSGDTVEPPSGQVTGKDNKKRAAKKPKAPKAETNGTPVPPPELTDELDISVPPGLQGVFKHVTDFKEIVNQLNAINRKLQELHKSPAGACLRLQPAQIDLKNLKETVRFDMPYCVCPVCLGIAKSRKPNCPCKQRGWLIEGAYKNLPSEYRQ